jgi:hypothetical protein
VTCQQKVLFCMYRGRERGLEFHGHETSQRCFPRVGNRMKLALSRFVCVIRSVVANCGNAGMLTKKPWRLFPLASDLYGPPAPLHVSSFRQIFMANLLLLASSLFFSFCSCSFCLYRLHVDEYKKKNNL